MPDISAIASANANSVTAAIKRAGSTTGAGFDFLMKMAARESNFDPTAKAKTSSAAGLFQFIDQTWLGAVKAYGANHGLDDYAADIIRDAKGRFTVADPSRRSEILNLRFDATASSAMAGELANENRSYLEKYLGRAVGASELYAAHFLGPAGAGRLLAAGAETKAADLLPQAAAANRNVFFDGARARSVGEVIASIAKSMGEEKSITVSADKLAAVNENAIKQDRVQSKAIAQRSELNSTPNVGREVEKKLLPAFNFPMITKLAPQSLNALTLSVLELFDPTHIGDDSEDRGRYKQN